MKGNRSMKHILYIEKVTHNTSKPYYAISDSRTNKQWILLQCNSTIQDVTNYCLGYMDAMNKLGMNYDGLVRYSENIRNEIDIDLQLLIITENEFQSYRGGS